MSSILPNKVHIKQKQISFWVLPRNIFTAVSPPSDVWVYCVYTHGDFLVWKTSGVLIWTKEVNTDAGFVPKAHLDMSGMFFMKREKRRGAGIKLSLKFCYELYFVCSFQQISVFLWLFDAVTLGRVTFNGTKMGRLCLQITQHSAVHCWVFLVKYCGIRFSS